MVLKYKKIAIIMNDNLSFSVGATGFEPVTPPIENRDDLNQLNCMLICLFRSHYESI